MFRQFLYRTILQCTQANNELVLDRRKCAFDRLTNLYLSGSEHEAEVGKKGEVVREKTIPHRRVILYILLLGCFLKAVPNVQ